jgi:hypothetical protein
VDLWGDNDCEDTEEKRFCFVSDKFCAVSDLFLLTKAAIFAPEN